MVNLQRCPYCKEGARHKDNCILMKSEEKIRKYGSCKDCWFRHHPRDCQVEPLAPQSEKCGKPECKLNHDYLGRHCRAELQEPQSEAFVGQNKRIAYQLGFKEGEEAENARIAKELNNLLKESSYGWITGKMLNEFLLSKKV